MEREEALRVALREQRMSDWIDVLYEAKELMYGNEELDADMLLWVDDALSAAMKAYSKNIPKIKTFSIFPFKFNYGTPSILVFCPSKKREKKNVVGRTASQIRFFIFVFSLFL